MISCRSHISGFNGKSQGKGGTVASVSCQLPVKRSRWPRVGRGEDMAGFGPAVNDIGIGNFVARATFLGVG